MVNQIIDRRTVAIPGPAGDASPEMIAAAEMRAQQVVDAMGLPEQLEEAVSTIPGRVDAAVAAENIPGQVSDAIDSQNIPGQIGVITTAQVPPLVAAAIAADDTVAQAAATAAGDAIESAGQRTFFLQAGAAPLLQNEEFATSPAATNPGGTGVWYGLGSGKTWETIPDGPDAATTNVVRFVESTGNLAQRRTGWAADGLAGRTIRLNFVARALPASGQTTASLRLLITLVSSGATLLDYRIGQIGAVWESRDVDFVVPETIGTGTLTFNIALHPDSPSASSRQVELSSARAFVPAEDLPTVVDTRIAEALAGQLKPSLVWRAGASYTVGEMVVTAAGHQLICRESHVSKPRFTDDLPKWTPAGAPPREQMLLGRAALGHGRIGVGQKSVFAIRFDDWHNVFKQIMLPLLLERGIPAGYASISRLSTQPWASEVTGDDMRAWNRQGIEICSHGVDHKDPSPHDLMGVGGLYDQIVNSKAEIEAWGVLCRGWMLPGATPLLPGVTPYGTAFASWDSLDTYAGWLIRNTYPVSEMEVWGATDRQIPHRLVHGASHSTISDGLSLVDAMALLNFVLDRGQNLEMMIHCGNIGKPDTMSLAEITQVLDWLVTKRDEGLIEVLTPTGLFFADRSDARTEVITNGGFERGAASWGGVSGSASIQAGAGHTGGSFLRITSAGSGLVTQSATSLGMRGWAGHTFLLQGWARAQTGTTTSRVTLTAAPDLALDLTRAGIGTEWTPVRHAFSIPPTATTLQLGVGRQAGSGIDWDDITIRPV